MRKILAWTRIRTRVSSSTHWASQNLVIRLGGAVGSAPARRVGDPSSNPGSGENLSLKLTINDLPDGLPENLIFSTIIPYLLSE